MPTRKHPKIDRKIADTRHYLKENHIKTIDPGILFGRVSFDDLDAYGPAMLAAIAGHAEHEIAAFDGKAARITVTTPADLHIDGTPVTVVSVTDRNMPFLYDSIAGEIAARHRDVRFAMHPILCRVEDGTLTLFSATADCLPDARISHIQIHLPELSDEERDRLLSELGTVLEQVHLAVNDWKPMLAKLDATIERLAAAPASGRKSERHEAVAFLQWLRDDNFTFLGMRDYIYTAENGGKVERAHDEGIGILADPNVRVLRFGKDQVTTTPEILAFLEGPDSLLVTKANTRSRVHRRAYMDYIGVKRYDDEGTLIGELRIVGLFTSTAYTRSVTVIPLLRMKVQTVVASLGFDPESHSGKMLFNTLESYPRDDLFQIETTTLIDYASQINELADRPRVRVLARIDRFDRFVSVIVFVPRDQYDSAVRETIGETLAEQYNGRVSAYYPAFPEGGLARVHFIIGRDGGRTPRVAQAKLETAVREIATRWEDRFAADRPFDAPELAVSQAYKERYKPHQAIDDLQHMQLAAGTGTIAIRLIDSLDDEPGLFTLKIFHPETPVTLTRRVPLLDNLGFRVISERTFDIGLRSGDCTSQTVVLHEMEIEPLDGRTIDTAKLGPLIEEAFLATWHGRVDNDRFNRLVIAAGLNVDDVVILRAYARYMRQLGTPYSQDFIAATLNAYPNIARKLFRLFDARFTLATDAEAREKQTGQLRKAIVQALQDVARLEDDRILRRFENAIMSTLRTNAYQRSGEERVRPATLAFKLNPKQLDGAPDPKPYREIFVFGAEVEGVHLRFGPIARGGLRWSDRPEDYRTEVLGLVKAQQVKNAVIVPVGAKGGFYPKLLPSGDRDAVFKAGKDAYETFISTLLSVTDNIAPSGETVPPDHTIRHDDDDPYFVVAADKGTATFSDTANAISQAHNFWLDDAFASGGSAGYDHKKMGITARGAWEAVKRHFREMDIDIQKTPFTVVGVGDMSGDVFGNGMLLSEKIRLIGAFDHRDIFIDPDPDTAKSFKERQRLFDRGRSSWQDYDKKRLSKGGMIISRSEKSVKLTREAAKAIGLDRQTASPPEIMTAILKTDADLLWFGGIGTYVKAVDENDADVGDRANDSIRITAREVGAKVIGEGANLGVTQKGRIAYGLAGGRCNSDAIDNSAGVNSSDVEVNIKIALARAMRDDRLTRPKRNVLLERMTEDVAALVLRNNYLQSLAISLTQNKGDQAEGELSQLMIHLEDEGRLDRKVETLPDTQTLNERYSAGKPLTRAEIGVLLSYAKIALFDELAASKLPSEEYFEDILFGYFPAAMQKTFADDIRNHRLRNEIIATLLANDVINRGGPGFVSYFGDANGALPSHTVKSFVIARDGLDLASIYDRIDALDAKLPGQVQNRLYAMVGETLRMATGWALRTAAYRTPLAETVGELRKAVSDLAPGLFDMAPPFLGDEIEARLAAMRADKVPEKLAREIAMLPVLALVAEIGQIASACDTGLKAAARHYFAVTDTFRIGRIEAAARRIDTGDHYNALALARNLDEIAVARRQITMTALTRFGGEPDPIAAWLRNDHLRIGRVRSQILSLAEGGDFNMARLTVAAGMLADLARGGAA